MGKKDVSGLIYVIEESTLGTKVLSNPIKMNSFRHLIGREMNDSVFKDNPSKKFHLLRMREAIAKVEPLVRECLLDIWKKYTGITKALEEYNREDLIVRSHKCECGKSLRVFVESEDRDKADLSVYSVVDNYEKFKSSVESFYEKSDHCVKIHKLILTHEESKNIPVEMMGVLTDFVEFIVG